MLRAAQASARAHPIRAALGTIVLFALALRVGYVLATPQHLLHGDAGGYFDRGLYLFQYGHLRPYFPGGVLPLTPIGSNGLPLQPTGGYPDAYWPPMFPMVLAGLIWFYSHFASVGNAIVPSPGVLAFIRLFQTVTNAAVVGCVGVVGIRLFGRRTGLIAAAIAAVFPPLIYVGASLYSESLFVPLLAGALAALVQYLHTRRSRWLVLCGVLTGLGTLTHSDGPVLVVPFVIVLVPWRASARWITSRSWRAGARVLVRGLIPVAVLLLAVIVVMAPWTIRNEVKFHHFVPISTSAGETLAGTFNFKSLHEGGAAHYRERPVPIWLNPTHLSSFRYVYKAHPSDQVQQSAVLEHSAIKYITAHPGQVLRVVYWNTRRLLDLVPLHYSNRTAALEGIPPRADELGIALFWVVSLVALIGVFSRRAWRADTWWLWIAPVIFYLLAVLFSAQTPRFQAPPDLFVVLLAGLGIDQVLRWGPIDQWLRRLGPRSESAPAAT